MTITIIIAIIALAAGILAGILIAGRGKNALVAEKRALEAQLSAANQSHTTETALLNRQLESQKVEAGTALQAAKEEAAKVLEDYKAEADKRLADYKDEVLKRHNTVVDELKQNHQRLLDEQDRRHRSDTEALEKRFADTITALREQVENTTNTMLKQRQEEFSSSSTKNIDSIVKPLKETIDKMKEEMANNSKVQTTMSAEIKTNMEHMIRQSIEAQRSAEELTRAFKHESKTQGDWGEVILSNMLAAQGFTEGKDFETQVTMKDGDGNTILSDDGNRMIPDVLLHLDDRRDVIIDSKVSMTAYIDYANAADELTRRHCLKEHIASLKKHVDELSAKNYTQYLLNPHLDFVIMFVPHIPALRDAMQEDPTLWQDAMQKKVFIADEQTLYAALRIIRITWTHIDQEQNHKRLFELAQEMINRTGLFLKEYETVGRSLRDAVEAFENGKKKLQPGGLSIGTTANNILKLGVENRRSNRKGKRSETIIPTDYLSGEVKTELLEEGDEPPAEPDAE
jgi:DNA recombination protein RmuC